VWEEWRARQGADALISGARLLDREVLAAPLRLYTDKTEFAAFDRCRRPTPTQPLPDRRQGRLAAHTSRATVRARLLRGRRPGKRGDHEPRRASPVPAARPAGSQRPVRTQPQLNFRAIKRDVGCGADDRIASRIGSQPRDLLAPVLAVLLVIGVPVSGAAALLRCCRRYGSLRHRGRRGHRRRRVEPRDRRRYRQVGDVCPAGKSLARKTSGRQRGEPEGLRKRGRPAPSRRAAAI
jgi:hypothetical protein